MKKSTFILIWGGATGIAMIIFSQILYAAGAENSGIKSFGMLIFFLGLFLGILQFRKKANGGYLTFGEGFKTGFLMCLIITLLATIAIIINLQVYPDIIDKIRTAKLNGMINAGFSQADIQMRMPYIKMFTTPLAIVIFAIIGNLIGGTVFSLISAGLLARKKPIFDDTNEMPSNDIPQA